MKNCLTLLFLALVCCLSALEIRIADRASKSEKTAAKELSEHWEKVAGENAAIATNATGAARWTFRLGRAAALDLAGLDVNDGRVRISADGESDIAGVDGEGAAMVEEMILGMGWRVGWMSRHDRRSVTMGVRTEDASGNPHTAWICVEDISSICQHRYDRMKSVVRMTDGTHIIVRGRMNEIVGMAKAAEREAARANGNR